MKILGKFLCKFWSILPIMALTRDLNYGYNELGLEKGLRFSLINLVWGSKTFYIISWVRPEERIHFSFLQSLLLDEYQWKIEHPDINFADKNTHFETITEEYVNQHVKELREGNSGEGAEDLALEQEFLLYLHQANERRVDISLNKMNYYTAVILVVVPLLFASIIKVFDYMTTLSAIFSAVVAILLALLTYMLCNWGLLAVEYMSVSGVERSQFNKLKNPEVEGRTRKDQLLYNYYFDWQNARFNANLRVEYVRNTEKFVKWSIGLCVLVSVILLFNAFLANII